MWLRYLFAVFLALPLVACNGNMHNSPAVEQIERHHEEELQRMGGGGGGSM
jgi:hypothetical protein